jgi:hypothetical protein
MITENDIRSAYIFLRKNNHSIPDETLDFMLQASLAALKQENNFLLLLAQMQIEQIAKMDKATSTYVVSACRVNLNGLEVVKKIILEEQSENFIAQHKSKS